MPAIEYPRGQDTPVSHLPFSPSVAFGDLIFVSGQASVDSGGNIIAGTFKEEFHRSMKNLIQILEDSGSDLAHVLQTRNYLRDPANGAQFQALYREYFQEPFPARTTITHCLPETLHYEIECIAIRKSAALKTEELPAQ